MSIMNGGANKVESAHKADIKAVDVLVWPGCIDHFHNVGDIAMLQVLCRRVKALRPSYTIGVIARDSFGLSRHCPDAVCIPLSACTPTFPRVLPTSLVSDSSIARRLEATFIKVDPLIGLRSSKLRRKLLGRETTVQRELITLWTGIKAFVVSGMGGLTDSFPENAAMLLRDLSTAIALNKPTILCGQGIGPLENADLRQLAQNVLPRVTGIGLRERVHGPLFLESLGVEKTQIDITGDDAIELAYSHTKSALGHLLGVNVRISEYAGVSLEQVHTIGAVLQNEAFRHSTRCAPISISSLEHDLENSLTLCGSHSTYVDADQTAPEEVIKRIGQCRVVVTGSYHAGVFALSQGVPVVGLAKTKYYQHKFEGLKGQFETGVEVVSLSESDCVVALGNAVRRLWKASPVIRTVLLESARRQMLAGKRFYETSMNRVDSSR